MFQEPELPGDILNYESFKVLDWSSLSHREYLRNTFVVTGVQETDAFKNIGSFLDRLGCQSVLLELNYVDIDYRSEFSGLYSKTFARHDAFTRRFHFFSEEIKSLDDVLINYDKLAGAYLGFMVVRPTAVGRIGRTVVRPKANEDSRVYPLCTAGFKTHILGQDFTVVGSPFTSQDTQCMCCAHSAIWVASYYLHAAFGYPRYSPYQISELVSQHLHWFPRTIPATGGLTIFQIVNALNNMGYYPWIYSKARDGDANPFWDAYTFIYGYIESRIPVIVGVGDHACTVIGHTFDDDKDNLVRRLVARKWGEEDKNKNNQSYKIRRQFIPSNALVDSLIVNDDNLGPYRILPFDDEDLASFEADKEKREVLVRSPSYKTVTDIYNVIVPLPEKVYLTYEEAETLAASTFLEGHIVNLALNAAAQSGNKHAARLIGPFDVTKEPLLAPIIRCYFINSSIYKNVILKSDVIDEAKYFYLEMSMPHYIWVAEISAVELYCKKDESDRMILGELIIDSTASKRDPRAVIAAHVPGFILALDPVSEELSGRQYLDGDGPYSHSKRLCL